MLRWPLALAAAERRVTGPEDEFDDDANGDPDSLKGEDDESGFDEMGDLIEPLYVEDDGYDDAGADDDDDESADDDTESDEE